MRKWTAKDLTNIRIRREAGETFRSISTHFGVSERAVANLSRRNGLKQTVGKKAKYCKVLEQTDMLIHPKQHIKKTRYCLKCAREFISKWFGNRMCSDCKNDTSAAIIEYSGSAARRNGQPFGGRT